mmetsp:Transcript_13802/g.20954  ORF Transcript_13802/g.20954 Transcript_13802/m.20954 type:complete len:175 (+) Transcript_13802:929-1453(+)
MLANDGADVYSVDIDSIFLFKNGKLQKVEDETVESCVRKSNIVVTGVPTKSYRLPTEWIQKNTTVVNVASYKNVDQEELLKVEGVTYVPMVGKVTVAMLERNLMRLYENFHHPDRRLKALGQEEEQRRARKKLDAGGEEESEQKAKSWFSRTSALQLYNAVIGTAILAVLLSKK